MFSKGKIRFTIWIAAVCMSSAAISGCQTEGNVVPSKYLPSPADAPGMTLVWGEDIKKKAIPLINSSKHECFLDIYELSDPDILKALSNAHARGVDVRVVLDATEKHSQSIGFPTLRKEGVPVYLLRIPRGISHIKMLYVDGQVLMGGMNYGADSWLNNDASVYIQHPNSSFKSLFFWDYKRANGIPSAAPVPVSPLVYDRGIEQDVMLAIQNAHESIAMEAFDLTDSSVVHALESANNRGVTVEVLLDPTQSYNRKTAAALRNAGITVRFYRSCQNELMHAKIVDIDHGKTFIIGSANFSHQAYTYNHESDIVLHHVPTFDISFQDNLSFQVSRGTDYPVSGQQHKNW